MKTQKLLLAMSLIIGLGSGSASLTKAAEDAGHAGHQAGQLELSLNNGEKWRGDENMISGMNAIRSSLTPLIPAIHGKTLAIDQYTALASDIQAQVDFMVANCKLSPEVDEQFHMILGQVLEGVTEMQSAQSPEAGAVLVVSALNTYGEYFAHPGWQPLE